MQYKLLKEYVEAFGKDFPVSSVKDTMNHYEVTRTIQECLEKGKTYEELYTAPASSNTSVAKTSPTK